MGTESSAAAPPPDDLATLIAAHRDDAYRLARRLVRTTSEAEDLTQTAILNTLRRAEYISGPENVKAYLLTTVRNLWRNQLRERSRRRFIGDDIAEELPSSELAPDEQVLTLLDTALAEAALATISERSREVIWLRYMEECVHRLRGTVWAGSVHVGSSSSWPVLPRAPDTPCPHADRASSGSVHSV